MEQYFSDLYLHFFCNSNVKPKKLSKIASLFSAQHEIHSDLPGLTKGLSENKSFKNQIIVFERQPDLSDHHTLHIIRNFPSIVLDNLMGENHSIPKKHAYWKSNCFLLGSNLENISPYFLESCVSSLFPFDNSIKDTIPWNAASQNWDPVKDANRKLSIVLEKFLDSTCPKFSGHEDVIEFAKYIQNRGKGRGTFKTIGFDFFVDANRIVVTARLDWFNKSEQSLKVLYSGMTKCPYSYAHINIANPKELEITGVWHLMPAEDLTKTLMVSGLPGVKIEKRHMFETKTQKPVKVFG